MPTVFTVAFASMVNIEAPDDCKVRWFRGVGWCQARRRTHACEQALDWGADLIVQLDVDQIYEPDVLKRLVARFDEGYRIIAAMVPGRGFVKASKTKPFQRLAWKAADGGRSYEPITSADGEVVEAEFPTSACVLFAAKDLKRLPRPWYYFKYEPSNWRIVAGEDGTFFVRMAQLGVKAFVDTTIKVKHAHVFEIDETFSDRFADWADEGVGEAAICRYD